MSELDRGAAEDALQGAWPLKGTGREEVTADDRSALGAPADRLPLFG